MIVPFTERHVQIEGVTVKINPGMVLIFDVRRCHFGKGLAIDTELQEGAWASHAFAGHGVSLPHNNDKVWKR